MNISSILITLVGIIIIIALYVVSRLGQNNMPNKEVSLLPDIKDENGDVFTSILDDIPASDGSTPQARPLVDSNTSVDLSDNSVSTHTKTAAESSTNENIKKQQLVLFVSAKDEQSLDGDLIKQSLLSNGLNIGDKDIYHYFIEDPIENNKQTTTSLFRIANGMEPWTLKDTDLSAKKLAGLSMVMLLPCSIDNKTAIKTFIVKADSIATQVNGVLKNQQQELLTKEDRAEILNTYS